MSTTLTNLADGIIRLPPGAAQHGITTMLAHPQFADVPTVRTVMQELARHTGVPWSGSSRSISVQTPHGTVRLSLAQRALPEETRVPRPISNHPPARPAHLDTSSQPEHTNSGTGPAGPATGRIPDATPPPAGPPADNAEGASDSHRPDDIANEPQPVRDRQISVVEGSISRGCPYPYPCSPAQW